MEEHPTKTAPFLECGNSFAALVLIAGERRTGVGRNPCPPADAALNPRANGAAIEAILRHAGLWRDAPARSPPLPARAVVAGADQDRQESQPYPLSDSPAASQPELSYIADGDGQGFWDDDSQQTFPDFDGA